MRVLCSFARGVVDPGKAAADRCSYFLRSLHFYRSVAANVEIQAHDLGGVPDIFGRQPVKQLIDGMLEFGNERTFHSSFFASAEQIECTTAQALQFCEYAKSRQHPCTEFSFARTSSRIDTAVEDRWRKMITKLHRVAVALTEFFDKPGVGVQARHFVFIFVSQGLELAFANRPRQYFRCRAGHFVFCIAYTIDQGLVLGDIPILIARQGVYEQRGRLAASTPAAGTN